MGLLVPYGRSRGMKLDVEAADIFCVYWAKSLGGNLEIVIEKRNDLPRSKRNNLICKLALGTWVERAIQGENLYLLPQEKDWYAPQSILEKELEFEDKDNPYAEKKIEYIKSILCQSSINLGILARDENAKITKLFY